MYGSSLNFFILTSVIRQKASTAPGSFVLRTLSKGKIRQIANKGANWAKPFAIDLEEHNFGQQDTLKRLYLE